MYQHVKLETTAVIHGLIPNSYVRLIKKKDKQRNKARNTGCPVDVDKFKKSSAFDENINDAEKKSQCA